MLHDVLHYPPVRWQELLPILCGAAIFSRFTDDQLEQLARRSRLVRLDAGETLFRRGEKARALYLLISGQLKLYRASADGDEVVIDLVDPGATFAESRAFLEEPHFHLNCTALADAEVAAVDLPAFLALLNESVDTCLLLLRRLSERAERRVDDIDQLALHSGSCRVAGYLLGQLPPRRNEYLLKVPKGVLANRLAIRAETLSRILKQLNKEGILSVHGNLVRVHSREKLQRLVDEAG
jgi:CRP-like cAMP-binding protein